jgi:molecular chaperone GrpE
MSQKSSAIPDKNSGDDSVEVKVTDSSVPDVAALQAEVEALRRQVAESLDKFVRARADTENVRKRAEADVSAAHKYAIERFAGEVLAVRDSLEHARAVDLQATGVVAKVMEGIDLTIKLTDSIFEKFGLVPVAPPAGEKFDPERHQAMGLTETTEYPANSVVSLMQKGYLLNGRLLRPALVFVSKVPLPAEGEENA